MPKTKKRKWQVLFLEGRPPWEVNNNPFMPTALLNAE